MNPYIIGPYKESDAGKFKGRSCEIEGMFRSFIQNDYLVCYADSGEGKSSILNAGLFPKLRDNRYFPISIRFNFYDSDVRNMDFDRVVNAAIDISLGEHSARLIPSSLIFETEDDNVMKWQKERIGKYVWLRLRYSELMVMDENGESIRATPVLVFDQFEEVFTNPESQIWTSKFFKWLEEISTDVCPEHILCEIEAVEDDVPLMASAKRFKAIFSLRSEYVGDVDYWGLQHYYIPDLKNNRYFLKPLTPQGAEEVVAQDGGLTSLLREECASLIAGCAVNYEYVGEGLPCIPASILSVICHEIYGYSERDRRQIIHALNVDKNNAVENVLEKYYIETLAKCGIVDDRFRDSFENALVDDKGNRKRIGIKNKDLSVLSHEHISRLVEENMLRVVSKSEEGDGDVVELPHDRFCLIIKNHKNKRFKEIQQRNRSLKEWMHFGVLCTVFGTLALLMHFDFIEKLRPIINDMMYGNHTDVWDSFKYFIQDKSQVSDHSPGWMALVSILLLTLIIPSEFLGIAKQWKFFTLVASVLGVSASGWFVRLDSMWDFSAGTSIFISLLISLGTLTYTVVRWRQIMKSDVSVWPLWGSMFLFFSYLYYEFVCCLIIGVNEPWDSWFFIALLPTIFLIWAWSFFDAKVKSKDSVRGKILISAIGLLLFVSLSFLAYNAGVPYYVESKFSYMTTVMLLVLTVALVIALLRNIQSVSKRLVASVLGVAVVLIVYVFNLGYNPLKIRYGSVYRVANWRSVYVKDNITGLYGILNASTGDTIIPCVADTFNVYTGKIKLKSDKFKSNPISGGAMSNTNGSFSWKRGSVVAEFISCPTLEEHIIKSVRNSEVLLDGLSARLYCELRHLSIDYVIEAKPYLLSDVEILQEMKELQEEMLGNTLTQLLNSSDTTMTMYGPLCRPKLAVLTDKDLYEFYAVATRNLFLHIVQDRIYCADYPAVIGLLQIYPFIYFTSVPLMNMKMSFTSNASLSGHKLISDFKTSLCSEDILSHKCFVWYDLFINLCLMDNASNAHAFQKRIQAVYDSNTNLNEHLMPILLELHSELPGSLDNIKNASSEELMAWLRTQLDYRQKLKATLQAFTDRNITTADVYDQALELDRAFDMFSSKLIEAMQQALNRDSYGMYNSAFEDICRGLMMVRLTRGYDITDEFKRMEEIDKQNNEYYDSFTKLSELASKSRRDREEIYSKIQELLEII